MFLTLLLSIFAFSQVSSLDQIQGKKHIKGAEIKILASPQILKTKEAFVGYLTIPANGKVPEHRDETEEYLFVIKGSGKIWINDKSYNIQANDLIYMPAQAKVRYENGPSELQVLQIFANPGPEKKYQDASWK